jgi:hypothetical protein
MERQREVQEDSLWGGVVEDEKWVSQSLSLSHGAPWG